LINPNPLEGIAGAVISAPLLALAVKAPSHKLLIARIAALVAPKMRMDNEINSEALSRDPEVGRAYDADPLVHHLVSARWFAEATEAMDEVMGQAGKITLPILVMHGTADKLANVEATRRFCNKLGSSDKELVVYPNFYHELFNEPEKDEIYNRVSRWLDAHNH
jgi:lysophospholipase